LKYGLEVGIFKNSKNQNSNKFIFKEKMEVRILSGSLCIPNNNIYTVNAVFDLARGGTGELSILSIFSDILAYTSASFF